MADVKVQRALNAQKEASGGAANAAPDDVGGGQDSSDATDQLQRDNQRALARAQAASEAMADELNFEVAERKQFWWELGVWGCLTLLASALLAERRDAEERSPAHK
jgi:membrane protease subunit (stomatin/prohibitin family)